MKAGNVSVLNICSIVVGCLVLLIFVGCGPQDDSDLPNIEELTSAGLIDNASIDPSIFGTNKFSKDQTEEKKERPLKPEEIVEYEISAFDVMFTSLGMIMLAFFILMNAFCVLDPAKERAVIGSLLGSFGVLPSGYGTSEEGTVTPQVEEISLSESCINKSAI